MDLVRSQCDTNKMLSEYDGRSRHFLMVIPFLRKALWVTIQMTIFIYFDVQKPYCKTWNILWFHTWGFATPRGGGSLNSEELFKVLLYPHKIITRHS
jgi:hypothetical protein